MAKHRAQVDDGDFWCISRNFSGNGASVRKASKSTRAARVLSEQMKVARSASKITKSNKRIDVHKSEIIGQAKLQGAKQGAKIIVTRLWGVMCRMIAMR